MIKKKKEKIKMAKIVPYDENNKNVFNGIKKESVRK